MKNVVKVEIPSLGMDGRFEFEEGKTADTEKNFRKALRAKGYGRNFLDSIELQWQAPRVDSKGRTLACIAHVEINGRFIGTILVTETRKIKLA